jgi:stage II sporulation protein D
MRRLCTLLLFLSFSPLGVSQERTVRIGVLGIFHSASLTLASGQDAELVLSSGSHRVFVRPRSSCNTAEIRAIGDMLFVRCGSKEIRAPECHAASRNQQATGLLLEIPGKIKRKYEGTLDLRAKNGEIIPVVEMDLEIAVASVVQAESMPDTPLEALKAQAIVSRSYMVAGRGRHADFDFCDTTHCQFLREPPEAGGLAAQATAATRGIVLTYDHKPVAAMFTRSCGGDTRTPAGIGLPSSGYPYYSVRCEICNRDPARWTRTLSREDAALLLSQGENGRIAIGRKLGWDAVPSDNFTAREQSDEVILEGVGQGHGVGLCQRGARSMGKLGSDFRTILGHYFPNTDLESLALK